MGADGAEKRTCTQHSEPHVYEDGRAKPVDKSTGGHKDGKALRMKSAYPPGAAFVPSERSRVALQKQLLELLKRRGAEGVTKLDAPQKLSWSLPQHVFGLRRKGHVIETVPEQLGASRIGRYVLEATDSGQGG